MERFTTLTAIAAPLLLDNVDTDVIIRIERIFEVSKDDLGPWAFEPLRYGADGAPRTEFVLSQPAYRDAAILLAGKNFGCGSSREHAVWAIRQCGIRAIVASSFGGIFFENCCQNGVLPIILEPQSIARLAGEVAPDPQNNRITIDLVACEIRSPTGAIIPFAMDARRRTALLEGLDDIDLTLKLDSAISAFRARDEIERPWVYV